MSWLWRIGFVKFNSFPPPTKGSCEFKSRHIQRRLLSFSQSSLGLWLNKQVESTKTKETRLHYGGVPLRKSRVTFSQRRYIHEHPLCLAFQLSATFTSWPWLSNKTHTHTLRNHKHPVVIILRMKIRGIHPGSLMGLPQLTDHLTMCSQFVGTKP